MESYDLEVVLAGVRPAGCVQAYVLDFIRLLSDSGYSLLSTREFVRSAAHFGRWLDSQEMGVSQITDSVVEAFGQHLCACPGASRHGQRPSRSYVQRVRRFVERLRHRGVLPAAGPAAPPATHPLIDDFCQWMRQHRGLTDATCLRYQGVIAKLLPALGDDPSVYDAALVRRVVLEHVRGTGLNARNIAGALRSFLRFLSVVGRCRADLDRAVPTVPQWRLSALPRYLEPDVVEQLIASCDLDKPHGVRDRAVLMLLARLGLRANDIVVMRMDDIDWGVGALTVRGKSRRAVVLPLPQDTGDAVLRYLLDARPVAKTDRVFLCANAPLRPLAGSSTVSGIVMLALRRAGISDPPSKGAHLLRHSAATAMLRSGIGLDAIATVLRHRSLDTTAHYAKVDTALLKRVAQPWPGTSRC